MYVFTQFDKERKKNITNCSYERPLPTRGNCVLCGRSGPLGKSCTNGCTYERWASESLNWAAQEREYKNDTDLAVQEGEPTTYRERKHDRIRSDLERWEDPWLWVFRLHDDCEWWNTCKTVSMAMDNDLENPRPGKRHKYF